MKLTEILDSAYDYNIFIDNADRFQADFDDDAGHFIEVNIIEESNSDVWLLEFTRDAEVDLTGGGDALKILSTVTKILKEFISKKTPGFIVFAASKKDRSRAAVYRHIMRRNKLPYYKELSYPAQRFQIRDEKNDDKLWALNRRGLGLSDMLVLAHEDDLKS